MNLFDRHDKVLVVNGGSFGQQRFADSASFMKFRTKKSALRPAGH